MSTPAPGSPPPRLEPHAAFLEKGTPANLRAVVDDLGPTINKALRAYTPNVTPVIQGRARVLAAQAVKSFSAEHGADLKTHVYRQLQRLQREAPGIVDPMAPPERTRRDSAAVLKAISAAAEDIGREPTDEEISEISGLPVRRVTKIRGQMRQGISESRYTEGLGDDDSDESNDLVATQKTDYDDWVDAVYHDLPEVDRIVLQYRTGYRGAPKLSNVDIAQRLKISPAAVSQRATRIQAKLDEFHGS